jgi:hypothetical protein
MGFNLVIRSTRRCNSSCAKGLVEGPPLNGDRSYPPRMCAQQISDERGGKGVKGRGLSLHGSQSVQSSAYAANCRL